MIDDSEVFEMLVTITDPEFVSVRWLEAIDRAGGGVYHALEDTLKEIEGVEKVYMRRYSAEIEIATHVLRADQAAVLITEEISDPTSEFQHALRFALRNKKVKVTNAGKTL